MLEYVKNRAGVGDCYLIPATFPAVGTGRGSMSASFTPPPRPRPGSNLIPVDLQRFRLATGASIYVDFKSVPYAPLEVLEWERRMKQVEKWYAVGEWKSEEFLHELLANGITHVILPVTINFDKIHNRVFYKDDSYVVIRMRPRTIPNAEVK